jgi:hypothetical protein
MDPSDLSEPVQEFLRTHVESYEELELLLQLRARGDRWCSFEELGAPRARALQSAEETLSRLYQQGLIELAPGAGPAAYRYKPRDPALESLVDSLALAYRDNPLGVMKLMTSNAVERVRNEAARTLFSRGGARSATIDASSRSERDKKER